MTGVLVFGASGFIGSQVRAALAALAALERDGRVERVTCPGRDRCDLLAAEPDELAALLREERPAAVVNCTGRLDGTGYQLVRANTLVTAKLIDAIAAVDPAIRLVRLGSAGEYGPVPRGQAVAESDPAAPVSEYGVSHLAATRLLELARAAGRADGVTLRVFNPIGPGVRDENLLGRAAARLRSALADGADHITMGPLSAYRDFVDARDAATALVAAALAPSLPHAVYNVGSGRAVTARAAVLLLAEAAGFGGEVREEGPSRGRSAAVDWIRADISRAAEALGWRPAYQLADSVKAIWADWAETIQR
jgi:nucleoside-diphosphate-sugar epimerase